MGYSTRASFPIHLRGALCSSASETFGLPRLIGQFIFQTSSNNGLHSWEKKSFFQAIRKSAPSFVPPPPTMILRLITYLLKIPFLCVHHPLSKRSTHRTRIAKSGWIHTTRRKGGSKTWMSLIASPNVNIYSFAVKAPSLKPSRQCAC